MRSEKFTIPDLAFEKHPLKDLNPAPYNPRKMDKDEYERLKKSILEFSMVEPIIWNKTTKNIVGGHQRYRVLDELNIEETTVVVVELEPEKEKILNIALNKIHGEFDKEKLRVLIIEIDSGDYPTDLTGFSYAEINEILDADKDKEISITEEDDVPDTPEKAITQAGDLWILGEHRLLCGDSCKKTDLEKLMDGAKASMVFTDPPYNVDYEDSHGRKILNDNIKDFRPFLSHVYSNLFDACAENAACYVCYAEANVLDFLTVAMDLNWDYRNTLIWLKDVQAMNFGHYTWKYEPILYLVKGKPPFYGKKNHPNVFEVPSFNSFAGRKDDKGNKLTKTLHPNQKPIDLITRIMANSSKKKDSILDLFGGSGSTLIACEKTNRKAFLMELDPLYCDVIVKRWETYTGLKAKRNDA